MSEIVRETGPSARTPAEEATAVSPAEQSEPSAPPESRDEDTALTADDIRRIRRAESVSVVGEACVITVVIHGAASFDEWDAVITRAIKRAVSTEHIERTADTGRVTYRVHVHQSALDRSFAAILGASPELRARRWVKQVEATVDSVQQSVTTALRKKAHIAQAAVECTWRLGAGVVITSEYLGDTVTVPQLREQLWTLKIRAREAGWIGPLVVLLVAILVLGLLFWVITVVDFWMGIVVSLYGLVLVLGVGYWFAQRLGVRRQIEADIAELLSKIELEELDDTEKQAYRLFRLNNAELKRYYDQARSQRTGIFAVGIAALVLGFGSVIGAWAIIARSPEAQVDEKIIIGVLGAIGAILANFIAVVFMKMFTDIVASTNDFHLRLVATHRAHFSNVLVSKIEDAALRDQTFASLALSLTTPIVPEGKSGGGGQAG